jgi:hypothetical protein
MPDRLDLLRFATAMVIVGVTSPAHPQGESGWTIDHGVSRATLDAGFAGEQPPPAILAPEVWAPPGLDPIWITSIYLVPGASGSGWSWDGRRSDGWRSDPGYRPYPPFAFYPWGWAGFGWPAAAFSTDNRP